MGQASNIAAEVENVSIGSLGESGQFHFVTFSCHARRKHLGTGDVSIYNWPDAER